MKNVGTQKLKVATVDDEFSSMRMPEKSRKSKSGAEGEDGAVEEDDAPARKLTAAQVEARKSRSNQYLDVMQSEMDVLRKLFPEW